MLHVIDMLARFRVYSRGRHTRTRKGDTIDELHEYDVSEWANFEQWDERGRGQFPDDMCPRCLEGPDGCDCNGYFSQGGV